MNEQLFLTLVNSNRRIIDKAYERHCQGLYPEEDHYQDTVLAAWERFPKFRHEAKFSTWLYVIARNTAIDKWRRFTSAVRTVSFDNPFYQVLAESKHDYDEKILQNIQFLKESRLKYLISTLSEREQDLVMLYAVGKSYKEMSTLLGESENLLRVHMYRIKERLYKKFGSPSTAERYSD